MSKGHFPMGFLDALIGKRRNGRITRAARRVRELQIHCRSGLPTDSPTLEVNRLLQDEGAFSEAMQSQADEQQARRQARLYVIQGE